MAKRKVRAKVLSLGKSGPFTATRTIKRENLGAYKKVKFRGVVVLVKPSTVEKIRSATKPPLPSGKTLLPPPVDDGVEEEEFIVREEYKGGRTKRVRGKSRGKTARTSVNIAVRVRGTQAERDAAAARLEKMLSQNLPFLKESGIVGRRKVEKGSGGKVSVSKAKFNGKASGRAARAILFELMSEVE